MKKVIDMITQAGANISTFIWLSIFLACTVLFFSVALWVILRGGKDVLEILTEVMEKK